jgi:hypothetical protein
MAYGLWPSLFACLISVLAYNWFFLPPLYTFTIADPENIVALFVFAVVAVIASNLAARVRVQAARATGRRLTGHRGLKPGDGVDLLSIGGASINPRFRRPHRSEHDSRLLGWRTRGCTDWSGFPGEALAKRTDRACRCQIPPSFRPTPRRGSVRA